MASNQAFQCSTAAHSPTVTNTGLASGTMMRNRMVQ